MNSYHISLGSSSFRLGLLLLMVAVTVGSAAIPYEYKRWTRWQADNAEDAAKDYTDAYADSLQAQLDTLGALADTADMGGQVIFWYGDSADCPVGWSVCNGDTFFNADSSDTLIEPDMVGRFVVCAGGVGNYSPLDTGGTDSTDFAHTHTISEESAHAHEISWEAGSDIAAGEGFAQPTVTATDGAHDHGGVTGSSLAYVDNRPRYIALWPLMRIKF